MAGKTYTIYIRDTDEWLWRGLDNKSEWIHRNLNEYDRPNVDLSGSTFKKDFPKLQSPEPVVVPVDE